jgi:hypothetical protein
MKNIIIILLLFSGNLAEAQKKSNDFSTIDNVIHVLYDVISGPAGDRDWDLFKALFHEKAIMGATGKNKDGVKVLNYFTPSEYVERNGPAFKARGFFEEELERITNQFGGVAQVFTSYQYRFEKGGEIMKRGINCVQLAFEKDRWYITQIIWEAETPENKLPKLLK